MNSDALNFIFQNENWYHFPPFHIVQFHILHRLWGNIFGELVFLTNYWCLTSSHEYEIQMAYSYYHEIYTKPTKMIYCNFVVIRNRGINKTKQKHTKFDVQNHIESQNIPIIPYHDLVLNMTRFSPPVVIFRFQKTIPKTKIIAFHIFNLKNYHRVELS